MKLSRYVGGAVAALAVSACISPVVVQEPPGGLEFSQLQPLRLNVTNEVLGPYGQKYGAEFATALQARLAELGYQVVSDGDAPLVLDVKVTHLKPGNAFVRFMIGMGAGRSALRYRAIFRDADSKILAVLDGGTAYNGTLDGGAFMGENMVGRGMVEHSTRQIARFMQETEIPAPGSKPICTVNERSSPNPKIRAKCEGR